MLPLTIGSYAATLVAFEGERAGLLSPEAAAPGARLTCALENDRVLKLKVHRCVKTAEGFHIDGSAFDLRREVRIFLQEHFADRSPTQA